MFTRWIRWKSEDQPSQRKQPATNPSPVATSPLLAIRLSAEGDKDPFKHDVSRCATGFIVDA